MQPTCLTSSGEPKQADAFNVSSATLHVAGSGVKKSESQPGNDELSSRG